MSAAARHGQPVDVISHGAHLDINQHPVPGRVTVVENLRPTGEGQRITDQRQTRALARAHTNH